MSNVPLFVIKLVTALLAGVPVVLNVPVPIIFKIPSLVIPVANFVISFPFVLNVIVFPLSMVKSVLSVQSLSTFISPVAPEIAL